MRFPFARLRERLAVLTLAALILGGGVFPQLVVPSRHRAAEVILSERERLAPAAPGPVETAEVGPSVRTNKGN